MVTMAKKTTEVGKRDTRKLGAGLSGPGPTSGVAEGFTMEDGAWDDDKQPLTFEDAQLAQLSL